jgi:hypothetical protein
MSETDRGQGMGTTGAPDNSGAGAIDEPDQEIGVGADPKLPVLDDPDMPFDHRPQPDDPIHRAPRH